MLHKMECHSNWKTKEIEKVVNPKTSKSASIGRISILFLTADTEGNSNQFAAILYLENLGGDQLKKKALSYFRTLNGGRGSQWADSGGPAQIKESHQTKITIESVIMITPCLTRTEPQN